MQSNSQLSIWGRFVIVSLVLVVVISFYSMCYGRYDNQPHVEIDRSSLTSHVTFPDDYATTINVSRSHGDRVLLTYKTREGNEFSNTYLIPANHNIVWVHADPEKEISRTNREPGLP